MILMAILKTFFLNDFDDDFDTNGGTARAPFEYSDEEEQTKYKESASLGSIKTTIEKEPEELARVLADAAALATAPPPWKPSVSVVRKVLDGVESAPSTPGWFGLELLPTRANSDYKALLPACRHVQTWLMK